MPELRDIATIRGILERDRVWSAYALGDLAPGFFEHCRWFEPIGGGALALVYGALTPPVLFAQGAPESLGAILDEFTTESRVYLHVPPEMTPVLAARYRIVELRRMWRMVLDPAAYRSAVCFEAVRLSLAD